MESSKVKNEDKKALIYKELILLLENITNYFSVESQDYLSLINFFEQLIAGYKEISEKIKIPKNFNFSNPDHLNLNSFYNFHSIFLNNIKEISEKIKTDILSTLKNYKEEFETDNKNLFFSLNSIIEDISHQDNKTQKNNNNKNKNEIEAINKVYMNAEKKFNEAITKFG